VTKTAAPDVVIMSIEESIVTIVREATLPSVQERFVAQTGVAVERAGYGVLRGVAEQGPVRLSDLAHQLGVDTSTVSRHVKALEGQGMLVRTGDPTDGRVARVALTAAGVAALGRLRVARRRLFAEVLADWPAADLETLAPLLVRFAGDFLVQGGRL
jgi:DNA-binding MarR family transcriptional regulator